MVFKMNKIKQVIIVEGKHDIDFLLSFLAADFIKTDGTSLPKQTQELLLTMAQQGREFIILTDPDAPGERIRKQLQALLPNAKHAFIEVKKSKYKNKVGVEHTTKKEVLTALDQLIDFTTIENTIQREDLYELGLLGQANSASKRKFIENKLRLGHGTGKTFLKRLNFVRVDKEKVTEMLKGASLWDK